MITTGTKVNEKCYNCGAPLSAKPFRDYAGRWYCSNRCGGVAWDRPEADPCERGTTGCPVAHVDGIEEGCTTW